MQANPMSATNRGTVRNKADFYPTPLSAFEPLLPFLPKVQIWEPACGDRRLIRAINESYDHKSFGPIADGADIEGGYDYLTDTATRHCVVTNPPYSLAFEFAKHAVFYSKEVFLLLRLNFLASKKRAYWFRQNEPSALFVLSQRPSFTGTGTDATDYAWFYWGSRHKGIFHL